MNPLVSKGPQFFDFYQHFKENIKNGEAMRFLDLQKIIFSLFVSISTLIIILTVTITAHSVIRANDEQNTNFLEHKLQIPYTQNIICSLLDAEGNGAGIKGFDGGTSNYINGTSYFTFGDTLLLNGGFLSNNAATSNDTNAQDCIDLEHKTDSNNIAQELLHRAPGELTVWAAAGQAEKEPGYVHYLYNSVITDNVYGFKVQGFGLAKFDTTNLNSTRVINLLLSQEEFPGKEVGAYDIITHEGYAYIYFGIEDFISNKDLRVARVPEAELENKESYVYWSGTAWINSPAESVNILETSGGQHGFNVRFNPLVGKWMALYSTNLSSAKAAAYSNSLTGPFKEETLLFDCKELFPAETYLHCYQAAQHPQFDTNNRQNIYITYANFGNYKLYLHKLQMARPFFEWTDSQGNYLYLEDGQAQNGFFQNGVAFYALTQQEPSLTPIKHWQNSSGVNLYRQNSPGAEFVDMGIAFYAATAPQEGLVPVYEWQIPSTDTVVYSTFDLAPLGYQNNLTTFYSATVPPQNFLDPKTNGYSFKVSVAGQDDNVCCGPANPSRQILHNEHKFKLITPYAAEGYWGKVCQPKCGQNGTVVWEGPVQFIPKGINGKLVLTTQGQRMPCYDMNSDGVVNSADLGLIAANFGKKGTGLIWDVDENGTVNSADLGLAASKFNQRCTYVPTPPPADPIP